jgi:hypothetical protein
LGLGLAATLVVAACSGDPGSGAESPGGSSSPEPTPPGVEATPSVAESTPQPVVDTIPQPVVLGDVPVAPDGERVDLVMPTFSDPTKVTNPLFPISQQESVLLLGRVDGKAFRTEVTLLPDTRIIEWEGQQVEALVSQYTAYLDGRIHEVAYDFYAQADDGAVWYFGEDVFNFDSGSIVDTHGTWIAGKDGPAAMIMPAHPRVGDVYRPENIPGFVFEEVTVKAVDQTLDGPLGPVEGGLVITELHMDGFTEDKSFGPGYGEFYTAGGGDVEALALAVPTDSLSGPIPEELVTLEEGATQVFASVQSRDWDTASATALQMTDAWESYRAGGVPKRIEPRMTGALEALAGAVADRSTTPASQRAIDAAQWALDLQLRYRPAAEIDLARFGLWTAQLLVDAAAGDAAAVNGDFFTLDYIRDRILQTIDGADVTRINTRLEELLSAVGDQDFAAVGEAAQQLRDTVARLETAT